MDELRAFVFGITVAIAIGPIALLILSIGINTGFWRATRCAAGAAAADFTYSVIALGIGTALIAALNEYETVFRVVASVVLMALGVWITIKTLKGNQGADDDDPAEELQTAGGYQRFGFVTVYLLTIVNPLTILIFVGFSGQVEFSGGFIEIFILSLLIFAGSLLVQLVLAAGGAVIGRLLNNPAVIRFLNVASGVLITGFGIYGMSRLI